MSSKPPRQVRRKALIGRGSAPPISEEDDPLQHTLPDTVTGAGPVPNGYGGGVNSEIGSGAENKRKEFTSKSII